MIKFSVLMSVYKNDDPIFFREALASLYRSTVIPDEVVLVVDGPIGHELEKEISHFSELLNVHLVRLKTNHGLGKALLYGFEKCSYDWIARFDSDDICHENRFEKQLSFIESNLDVDIFGSWIAEFESEPAYVHAYRKPPCDHNGILNYAKYRNPFNHMTVMYKKSSVLEAGGYQDDYLYEDYALWVRMIKNGCVTANIPEFLVYARTGNGMEVRRGGIKYVKSEVKAQYNFYKLGFISLAALVKNLAIRVPVRLVPGSVRKFIYRKTLRR